MYRILERIPAFVTREMNDESLTTVISHNKLRRPCFRWGQQNPGAGQVVGPILSMPIWADLKGVVFNVVHDFLAGKDCPAVFLC
jgi:hypothetical protein